MKNTHFRARLPHLLLAALILTNFIYFGLYAVQRHLAFETGAYDLGVYSQPLWNYLQGRDFSVSIQADNGPLRWANHVEPILFLILPLYKLWPDPRLLLWIQAAGLSLAGLPLYGLALRRLQNPWSALAIVLAFFLLPATEAVTLFDFHAVTLSPLFIWAALYFLDTALTARGSSLWFWPAPPPASDSTRFKLSTRYGLAALFFLLALSTKEDISLHVLMIGLYLLVFRRRWAEGGLLAGVGLAWFYVTFQVVIPHFRTGGDYSIFISWFETLGRTPLEIALSPFTAPDKVLALIFRPDRLPPLAMLTVPLALLPWLGLPWLALAAPSLAFSLLSDNPTTRQLETWHYAAPMLPFVMLAAVDGLARLNYQLSKRKSPIPNSPPPNRAKSKTLIGKIIFLISKKIFLIGKSSTAQGKNPSRRSMLLTMLTLLLLLTSLGYHYLRGYSHLARLPEWPQVTAHHQLGQELAEQIPLDASLLAQAQLIPHAAHRYQLAIWSGPLLPAYDYVWFDLSHPKLPNRFNAHGDLLTGLIIEHSFGPIAATDGYLLLKKGAARDPLPEALFTFTAYDQLPPQARPLAATFGNALRLVAVQPDVRRLTTSETEPQLLLYFDVDRQPAQDYNLFVYLLDAQGEVIGATDYSQPALFWWPTSRWQAGDRRQVRVNTIPWWTGDQTRFSYAIGFSTSDDAWDRSARLPVESTAIAPLDDDTLLPVAAFRRFAGIAYPVSLNPN